MAGSLLKLLCKRMSQHYPQLAFFNYDHIGRRIACDGYYEINYLNCLASDVCPKLKSKAICLDIGANIGNHSVFFADYFTKIYAYEPNLRPFKLLEANAMLKNNISTFNFGLSNANKTQKVVFDKSNIGSASLIHNTEKEGAEKAGAGEAIFQLKCLDKVLMPDEISKIAFMKIDVEGHEFNVLKGAVSTIKASKPIITLEVLANEIQDGNFASKEFLETLGYQFFYIFESKPRFKLMKRKASSRHEQMLVEAPQKFAQTGYPMVVCSPYDLKA